MDIGRVPRNVIQETFRIQQEEKISLSISPNSNALIISAHALVKNNWHVLEYGADYSFDGQTVHLLKPKPGCDIRVIYELERKKGGA